MNINLNELAGGAWKLEAAQNIKKYLEKELKEQIKEGKVIVLA